MVFVLAVVRGVIDEPFAVDQMQFRRPDVIAVPADYGRGPDADTRDRERCRRWCGSGG